VLGARRDDVVALVLVELGDALDRQVVGLGRAARPDDLFAPTSFATCSRAYSTASSDAQPKLWLRLAALPNFCVKKGSIASTTRGSTGVVAWLSM
jgi:hypothetical protein